VSALLTPAEVVARLAVSRQTLARWERSGYLVRDGSSSRPRYREQDVEAVAAERAGSPPAGAALLAAAADLLRERGVDGCTLEAVAQRVGITRAGVVHHHPTKEHLLEALARRFLDEFEHDWQLEVERTAPGPGRLCRAYAAVTLQPAEGGTGAGVLACALDTALVRDLVRHAMSTWYERLAEEDRADGLDGQGLRTCLAADGVWVLGLLHVGPLTSAGRAQAFPRALRLGRRGSRS
jgi:AcrR family transcriptional regulator